MVAAASACAASKSEPAARVEPAKRDPWALEADDEVQARCPPNGRRCSSGRPVPNCASAPAASELSAIDGELIAKVGQRVTVVAKPRAFGVICTLEGCDCCNRCWGPVGLCGDGGLCNLSIEIGSCDGDQRLTCCDVALEERPLVARGILRPIPTDEVEGPSADEARFILEQPEYCYLP